jgi:D-xylose transport system substrate-binding protein
LVTGEEDNGQEQVPTVFLDTIPVFQDNIEDTIIKDDFWSVDEICTKAYAQDCKDAGLQ